MAKLASLPLGFEPNRGQWDATVKYAASSNRYKLFLTSLQAVFVFPERVEIPPSLKAIAAQTAARQTNQLSRWSSVAMRLVGSRSEPSFSGRDQLPGKKNYYIGRDKTKWASGVPIYAQLDEHQVYPGIDVAFRGKNQDLEFDFVVAPGADLGRIKLAFSGARQLHIDASGNLILSSSAGDLEIHRPVAYQEAPDGSHELVDARFTRRHNGEIRLALGAYDRRRQLVIDPSVTYATYLGGVALDEGLGIATSGGNTYVTGGTASPNFPCVSQNHGPCEGTGYTGGLDVFVAAFSSSGQLMFSTIVGGSEDDVGTSLAVSPANGIFVTGYTKSNDFPAFFNYCYGSQACSSPLELFALCGTQNAFVLALTAAGAFNPEAAAYVGGSGSDAGLGVAVEDSAFGYFYLAGQTTSPDFLSCSPLFNEAEINMGHGSGPSDGFVLKMNQSFAGGGGPGLWFSTFLGGSENDFVAGIALDNPGVSRPNIYVTGGTVSPDFYTTPGVIQPTCGTDGNCNNGNDDAFVTVLCTGDQAPCHESGDTPNYIYSTFLGGSGTDDAYSIAADGRDNAYITGQTNSTDFKLQSPFQSTLKGTQNGFVSKLNPSGTGLVFSTYLGGSQSDSGLGIAIDGQTYVYITGRTDSPDFPLEAPTQATIGGGYDAFISVFNPSGSALTFSTFLGGSGDEDVLGGSIAVDSTQNVYVTGDTNSTNFPTVNPYQAEIGSTENCAINGNQVLCPDAFVAKINAPPSNEATLTVTITGPGSSDQNDMVTSSPPGIACSDSPNNPGTCVANFGLGSTVTLTATPDGSQFAGWGGDVPASCGTNPTCEIQINSNMSVSATFNQLGQVYTLTVSGQSVTGVLPGSGVITSSPPGIDCGDQGDVCSFDFAAGTQVTLTPTPDPGSYFYGWTGNPACSGTGPCVLIMSFNQIVDYAWASSSGPPPQPDFTLAINPQSLGTVQIGSQGVAGIAIATVNGFTDTVNLTCSVLPATASSPSCTISPSSLAIPLNGAGSATLTVNTSGLIAKRRQTSATTLALSFPFLGVLFGAGLGAQKAGLRNWLRILLGAVVLAVLSFAVACGSSSGGGNSGGTAQPGNYSVVVSGQGATTQVTHTAQVSITIQ